MLALLQEASSQIPAWLQETEAWATIFQGFVTPILIATGGAFAWYKFFRQGEHERKLQPTISGVVGAKDGTIYLQARVFAENTGQVSVALNGGAAALQVSTRNKGDTDWALYATERVFAIQGYVQPGETLTDQVWMEIPDNGKVAIKMELIVVTGGETTGWVTTEVVNLIAGGDNTVTESEGG